MSERERGRVQKWNGCFGWISRGSDLAFAFVHHTDLAADRKSLRVGREVEFEVEQGAKGIKAVNVVIVE